MRHSGAMQTLPRGTERRAGRDRRSALAKARITAAMAGAEIETLFQPQFAAQGGALAGAEALARWPAAELDGAGLFAQAEEGGQTAAVSLHVARTAMAAAASWPDNLHLSLNVTPAWLAMEGFTRTVLDLLAETGLEPARLTLEITEQSLVADLDGSGEALRPLVQRGVGLALDDFGAGFCNFDYLKRLPVDTLKLDRSMVRGIVEDRRDLEVLRAIVAMARALGLRVVAEGIETAAQRDLVAREGCWAWQGFLGSEPLPGEAFRRLAEAQPALR